MSRGAIIILLINYCASLFSQDILYTRDFDAKRRIVPIRIVNQHPDHFYVLRYNKLAHDLTAERRQKPSGEITAFTPLKLDSVNADWFDYEKLEYLFFEQGDKAFFVFEKTKNNQKAVYLKAIDTNGRSNGFLELATLEPDKTLNHFDFEFTLTADHKLLLIGTLDYINSTSKKLALLYDVEKQERVWLKKLPFENPYTGFSQAFTTDAENNLFYILAKAQVAGYKRKFVNNTQVVVPVLSYDSLALMSLLDGDPVAHRRPLSISGLTGLKSIVITTYEKYPVVLAHYTQRDSSDEDSPFFLSEGFNNALDAQLFRVIMPLRPELKKSLTFYDGTDFKIAADKDYKLVESISSEGSTYCLAGRSEANYFKELLLWKTNLRNGHVMSQQIVPRKIFYFDDRTRFNNIGVTAQQVCGDIFYAFVLEDSDNLRFNPAKFSFHDFSRQKYLWGANLIAYILKPDGEYIKKRIHANGGYDFVPLFYSSNQCDFVFYLNNGKSEKFAILKLGTF